MGNTPRPALGRSFSTLMQGASTAPGPALPGARPSHVSPGMATLLRGPNGDSRPTSANQQTARTNTVGPLVRVTLVVADLVICGLVSWMAFSREHPWGLAEGLVSTAAIVAGAWMTSLAICAE